MEHTNRSRKKMSNRLKKLMIMEAVALAILIILLVIPRDKNGKDVPVGTGPTGTMIPESTLTPTISPTPAPTAEEVLAQAQEALRVQKEKEIAARKSEADYLALQYDYDAAVAHIRAYKGYEESELLLTAISAYENQKNNCVVWKDNTAVSHIFFHSLIMDSSLAFGPDSGTLDGYNRYMTTASEFEKIMQSMYEKGYVLISIHDMAELVVNNDGTEIMKQKEILLPAGKKPFVMSQDDVNYYDYMDGEGFATKLVVGPDGKPSCEYRNPDGTTVIGDYDLVPILNKFIDSHPDFSYRGAKALLCVTGYEGALGYETAPYRYDEVDVLKNLTKEEKAKKLKEEQEACKTVAACLKADGFDFASHSYGHGNMTTCSVAKFKSDTERWKKEVEPLLGSTDVYVYPYGADICDWRGYSGEKYEYAVESGFHFFCNVDSTEYWVQIRNDYVRQGRINLDGERLFKTPELVTPFCNAEEVLDKSRPYRITD